MKVSATCCCDCPCQRPPEETVIDKMVPYRDENDCPTDEELLRRWNRDRCEACLSWWVTRAYGDPRYTATAAGIQRRFPLADVGGHVGEVVVAMWKYREEIHPVLPFFKTLLWRLANRDAGGGRKTKMIPADLHDGVAGLSRQEEELPDDQIDRLAECYEKISSTARSILDAIYFEGTKLSTIAKEMNLSYDACARRAQRTRHQLRQCIEQAA